MKKIKMHKIDGHSYKIGDISIKESGEIYFLPDKGKNGTWLKSNEVIYNHSIQKYIDITNNNLTFGIVNFNDSIPIMGFFTKDANILPTYVQVENKGAMPCINSELVENNKYYLEALSDGIFYIRTSIPAIYFVTVGKCTREYKQSLPYEATHAIKGSLEKFHKLYNPEIYPMVENVKPFLDKYSFGLEFETTHGTIPQRLADNLGIISLRDGSIEGIEFVTVPLEGAKGLQGLLETLSILEKRTKYKSSCALHLHIGGFPRKEDKLISLFKVLYRIQNEIFELFPLHKKRNYSVKRKSYTKPLPDNIFWKLPSTICKEDTTKEFKKIFEFLSMNFDYGNFDNKLKNVDNHPADPEGNRKWQVSSRYHWVNMLPIIFGNKKTIEFRIHTPTYNKMKVINYLFICIAILKFADKYSKNILNNSSFIADLKLHDIISSSFVKNDYTNILVNELINYTDRRRRYTTACVANGDIIGDEDVFIYSGKGKILNWDKFNSTEENFPVDKLSSLKEFRTISDENMYNLQKYEGFRKSTLEDEYSVKKKITAFSEKIGKQEEYNNEKIL